MEDYLTVPLIDCHIHMRTIASIINQANVMEACNLKAINVASVPTHGGLNINQNVLGALFKALYPDRVYWFGGLHHEPPAVDAKRPDFAGQLQRVHRMGCDGIKFIEGKPTVYKLLQTPLNDPLYDEFYAAMSADQIPLLFHVGDPSKSWDPERVSKWIRQRGWFYGDGTFPAREELYAQIDDILERFENLPVIFAHFYFMEDDIERAEAFLNRWPKVSFDLTPGWGMYGCFTRNPSAWREFFIRHQDQILVGTDNSGGKMAPNFEKVMIAKFRFARIKAFLGTTEKVLHEDGHFFQGIGLPKEVLEKLYHRNFQRYAGDKPRSVNLPLVIERCSELISLARAGDADDETMADLEAILTRLKEL